MVLICLGALHATQFVTQQLNKTRDELQKMLTDGKRELEGLTDCVRSTPRSVEEQLALTSELRGKVLRLETLIDFLSKVIEKCEKGATRLS